ncbi:MAG: thermosome subunit alpha [Thermoplasmata archaeon]
MQGQPVIILKEGTESTKGKSAQFNNIAAAKAVAEAVRSTLGPKGMDKMLVSSIGDITVTNDGVTILKDLEVEHPAAKMIVEVAKTQDEEVGDGTTSAVVIAGELLKKAEGLIEQDVHPTVIANGFRMAANEAKKLLENIGFDVKPSDIAILKKIARTAMTGKSVSDAARDKLADIVVKAVTQIAEKKDGKMTADIKNIKIEKKQGAAVEETELIFGVILDKERVSPRMPKIVNNAKIALIDRALEIKKTEYEAKIQIRDPSKIHLFKDEEERTLRNLADKIKEVGANVVVCEKGIDDLVQHYLANYGIYAVRRATKEDMEKVAKATGGRIVTNLEDLSAKDLGTAASVEERKIADSQMTFIMGCKNPKAVSILIRGGTEHVIAEVERAMNDALKVVSVTIEDERAVAGGGAPEIELALRLKDFAATVGGREQLAIEIFAQALEIIPWSLAENAGMDTIDTLIKLKSEHESKKKESKYVGVDVLGNKVGNMLDKDVIEPMRVKIQAISSASEVANMILRIDDVIAAKKREPTPPGGPGGASGMGGMPGGMPGMM